MGWDSKRGPYRYDGEHLYHLEFPKTAQADTFHAKYPQATYDPYGIYSMYKDRAGHMWFGTAIARRLSLRRNYRKLAL